MSPKPMCWPQTLTLPSAPACPSHGPSPLTTLPAASSKSIKQSTCSPSVPDHSLPACAPMFLSPLSILTLPGDLGDQMHAGRAGGGRREGTVACSLPCGPGAGALRLSALSGVWGTLLPGPWGPAPSPGQGRDTGACPVPLPMSSFPLGCCPDSPTDFFLL